MSAAITPRRWTPSGASGSGSPRRGPGTGVGVLATGQLLDGRYELGEVIARGGVADVYRAIDAETGNHVAVKMLRDGVHDELDRFEIEARSLARLNHPGIVRLCDQGWHEGRPYLVLDFVDGEPLSAVLATGSYSEAQVI